MAIVFRNYQGPEDLALQQAFWVQATRDLPWCWKPTRSPAVYSAGSKFDPRSRRFAFKDGKLVGYCSFTGQGDFVSMGYPWVLPGYEGELQEDLYESVYSFAAGREYGGRTFAQRFRQQWKAQVLFFERHGFAIQRRDPLYALDISRHSGTAVPPQYHVKCHTEFRWDDFCKLAAPHCPGEQMHMWRQYFETVDFDFAVEASEEGRSVIYLGFAVRSDTALAEIIAAAVDPAATEAFHSCLMAAITELRTRKARFLGTKPIAVNGWETLISNLEFEKVTEELLMFKQV